MPSLKPNEQLLVKFVEDKLVEAVSDSMRGDVHFTQCPNFSTLFQTYLSLLL